MEWVPHEYQFESAKFGLQNGRVAYFLDPGLGKTSIIYEVFRILQQQKLVNRALIIGPKRVVTSVWPRELEKWDNFHGLSLGVLHGPNKEHILQRWDDIQVINPEGLGWLFTVVQKWEWPWDMLVCDESTLFKHRNSLRCRTLFPMLDRFKRRYILTGTPAPNGLLDLWAQMYILDKGHSLEHGITRFRTKYFKLVNGEWLPRKNSLDEIYKAIDPYVMRLSAKDYLKLEPYLTNVVTVDLPAEAKRTYNQMERLMITTLPRAEEMHSITAKSAAAASMKCRQIANGGLYFEEHSREAAHIHDAKTQAVVDLVEELSGKPALVAYEFDHDLRRLQKAFPDAPYLGGGVSTKRQAEIEDAWNASLIPVLLAQPQSVAHGLNLQGVGAAVIWHSLTWNLEHHDQLIRRVWRQGQSERVVVHYLMANDTVDEVMMDSLAEKDATQQTLLSKLHGYVDRRRAA